MPAAKHDTWIEDDVRSIVAEGIGRGVSRKSKERKITGDLALELPRFEFIARWLVDITKKKENRGPLGLRVGRRGSHWQIVSPIAGGTVTFDTTDPALLFDYARRGELGRHIRDAEEFRALAHSSGRRR